MESEGATCPFYFTAIVAVSAEMAIVAGHRYDEGDDPKTTSLFRVEPSGWKKYLSLDQIVYAATKRPPTGPLPLTIAAVSRDGLYIENQRGKGVQQFEVPQPRPGYLLHMANVGDAFFVCGDMYKVFRGAGDRWESMTAGLPVARVFDATCMLKSIHGFATDDLYAVGSAGAMWRYDGVCWRSLEKLTHLHLYSVCCAEDGKVYVGGGGGTLLAGSKDGSWSDLTNPSIADETIVGLASFGGKVYAATSSQLLVWDGNSLSKVVIPVGGPQSFYALDSCDGALWSAGDSCVLSYDGSVWRRHDFDLQQTLRS